MIRFHLRMRALALTLPMFLAACATAPVEPPSDDDVVVERAKARWEAILAKDFETAYEFYSPGYRSATPLTDFVISMRFRRVKWTSAEYSKHRCEEDSCEVVFQIGYQIRNAVPGVEVWNGWDDAEESWVKTGGEWWFLPEN